MKQQKQILSFGSASLEVQNAMQMAVIPESSAIVLVGTSDKGQVITMSLGLAKVIVENLTEAIQAIEIYQHHATAGSDDQAANEPESPVPQIAIGLAGASLPLMAFPPGPERRN